VLPPFPLRVLAVFDKVFFLRYHATPPHYDARLGRSFTALLPLALVIHVAFAVWILSTPTILPPVTGVAAAVRAATDTAPTDSAITALQTGLGGSGGFVEVGVRVTNYATIPLMVVLVLLLGGLAVWYVLWPLAAAAAHALDARFPRACARCPAAVRPRPPRPPRARGLPAYFDVVPHEVLDDVVVSAGAPPGAYARIKPELAARLARTRAAAASRRSMSRSARQSAVGPPLGVEALNALVGRYEALTTVAAALRELQRELAGAAAAFVDDVRAAAAAATVADTPPLTTARALLARRLAAMGGGSPAAEGSDGRDPQPDAVEATAADGDGNELAAFPVARLRTPAALADVRALRLRALAALALPGGAASALTVADGKAHAAAVAGTVNAAAARVAAEADSCEARVTAALARRQHGDSDDNGDGVVGGTQGQPASPLRASLRARMPLLTTLPSRKRTLAPATPVLAATGDLEAGGASPPLPPMPAAGAGAGWLARLLGRVHPSASILSRGPTDSSRSVASVGTTDDDSRGGSSSGFDVDAAGGGGGDLIIMADQQWCYDVHEQRRFAARFGLSAGVASALKRRMAAPTATAAAAEGAGNASLSPSTRRRKAAVSSAGGTRGNALAAVLPAESAAAAAGAYADTTHESPRGSRPAAPSRGFGASLKMAATAAGAAATGALAAADLT
jgi:hypothetical protein